MYKLPQINLLAYMNNHKLLFNMSLIFTVTIRLYDINVVCLVALQEFPILCQTCLGDNPYIRMVGLECLCAFIVDAFCDLSYILPDTAIEPILFTEVCFGNKNSNKF